MDSQQFLERYLPFLKQHWLPLGLGLLGLIFLVYGLIALFGSSSSSSDVVFEAGSEASESAKVNKEIFIDVSGAVVKPGVYRFNSDSRVQDALVAAGGLSAEANRDWAAKNLNLAAKLRDGGKLYIPDLNESGIKSQESGGTLGGEVAGVTTGLININTASTSELDTLPGVGPVTAQKIINARPYEAIEDLLSKKIVGSKVFEQIKEKIAVY